MAEMKPATTFTSATNKAAVAKYAMGDRDDFTDADRGLIAALPEVVHNDKGEQIRDGRMVAYITDDASAPDSVNPSLWRQSQLIKREGLYKVVDGLSQARFGGANVTIVDGLAVIDRVSRTICTASALNCGLNRRRSTGMNPSSLDQEDLSKIIGTPQVLAIPPRSVVSHWSRCYLPSTGRSSG